MSISSERGKSFENKVRKMMSRKLELEIKRDKQSGAGIHKQDIRDRFNELTLFIECKDHQTIKPKEWWREADAKSSYGQAAVVVMPDNEEVLCVMKFDDLLNIVRESMDWQKTAGELRLAPVTMTDTVEGKVAPIVEQKIIGGAQACRAGHLADQWGYCQQVICQYSRGYRKPKVKKK